MIFMEDEKCRQRSKYLDLMKSNDTVQVVVFIFLYIWWTVVGSFVRWFVCTYVPYIRWDLIELQRFSIDHFNIQFWCISIEILHQNRVTARFIDVIIIACDAAHQPAVGWRRWAQIRVRRISNIIFISGKQCWWFNGHIDHNAAHITESAADTRRTSTSTVRSVRQSIRSS